MIALRLVSHSAFSLRTLALASVAFAGIAGSALAAQQDPIAEVLQQGAEWSDGFDAASVGAADVRTSIPTLSPSILGPMQAAIAQYSDIVSRGRLADGCRPTSR